MRLGRDAEVRVVGDQQVTNLSLAFNYGKKGADGNRPTQWIDATLWGKRAETLEPFLKKGTLHMFTLDDIHIETFQGNNGQGTKLAATVSDVELGPRMDGAAPAARPAAAPQPQRTAPAPRPDPSLDDDDIPF
jgi:single-strand DNA-binding protein